jgi:signal transduction histidine kinase
MRAAFLVMGTDFPIRSKAAGWCRAAAALVVSVLVLIAGPAFGEVLEMQRALRVEGDGGFARDGHGAVTVDLPDEWQPSRPQFGSVVWYRVGFDAPGVPDRAKLFAVAIERACSTAEVFLNGVQVYGSRNAAATMPRSCTRPLLLTLPGPLFKPVGNLLDIRVAGFPADQVASRDHAVGVSTILVGPQDVLAARHERRLALAVTLPQVETAMLFIVGLFVAGFGWLYRPRSSLWYFGGLIIAWSLMVARTWAADLPWSQPDVELVYGSPFSLVVLAGVQFFIRFTGHRYPRIDVVLLAQCLVMPASLALAGANQVRLLSAFWLLLLAAELVAGIAFFLVETWRLRRRRFRAVVAMVGVGAAAMGFEIASPLLPPWTSPVAGALAQTAIGLLLIGVGLSRIKRSGQRPVPVVTDQRDFEARVREATAQIERNFAQLADMKVEQVTERERKRIAADLHDDLGAKLLTIVHTSDNDRISTLAREALEEMRLSVRGLTGKPVRLADAIGDWRAEVVARLSQSGIEANWSSPADEDVPQTLSARAFVQTTRILREAVSNTIKHSGASQCAVRCLVADGDFQLVVQDNGNGIPMELDGRMDGGHGLASMKSRAKQLQGQCLMESGPGYGTVIRLTIPLDAHVELV